MNKMNTSTSRNKLKKAEVRSLLASRKLEDLLDWAAKDRTPFKTLASLLFDSDPLICWRSIEAFGKIAPRIAEKNINSVRRQLQRFLWLMNDESGGICWYAPEAIGEIIYNVPGLTQEYGQILIAFLNEEPFEGGVRWAIARLVGRNDLPERLIDTFHNLIPVLDESLKSSSPKIRGNALLALKALNRQYISKNIDSLAGDTGTFTVYDFDSGRLNNLKISTLATSMINSRTK